MIGVKTRQSGTSLDLTWGPETAPLGKRPPARACIRVARRPARTRPPAHLRAALAPACARPPATGIHNSCTRCLGREWAVSEDPPKVGAGGPCRCEPGSPQQALSTTRSFGHGATQRISLWQSPALSPNVPRSWPRHRGANTWSSSARASNRIRPNPTVPAQVWPTSADYCHNAGRNSVDLGRNLAHPGPISERVQCQHTLLVHNLPAHPERMFSLAMAVWVQNSREPRLARWKHSAPNARTEVYRKTWTNLGAKHVDKVLFDVTARFQAAGNCPLSRRKGPQWSRTQSGEARARRQPMLLGAVSHELW